ncbi:CvpA family protein [bacterium]|nr:CvpA family protein [bacterium]
MFDLTTLDYIYVGVVVASTIWATVRGGIYETVATLSWVVAAIAARWASPWLDAVFQEWFDLTESTVGTMVSSYFIVFFVILLLMGLFNQRLRSKIQESILCVTDHTLGVIFGITRGVVVMGLVYWAALWYYSDMRGLPAWIADARTRPIMQLTALKIQQWFIPGENKLLARDMTGTREAMDIYNNLINPAVQKASVSPAGPSAGAPDAADTGYKNSERTALENQLLQIETAARVGDDLDEDDE